jgi:hypothetical protein
MTKKKRARCPKVNKRRKRMTRFGDFLRDNKMSPLRLSDVTGITREHVRRLRYGECEPTRPVMIWLTVGCRALLGGRRRVRITDLFDLEETHR